MSRDCWSTWTVGCGGSHSEREASFGPAQSFTGGAIDAAAEVPGDPIRGRSGFPARG